MNRTQEDNGTLIAFGGIFTVIVIGAMAMKAVEAFFRQLAQTFEAFGNMVGAFVPMFLKILVIVGCVVGAAACIIAAIYFTAKYIGLVRRATDLKTYLDTKMEMSFDAFRGEIDAEVISESKLLRERFYELKEKVDTLLKPATATPPIAPLALAALPPSDEPCATTHEEKATDADDVDDNEEFLESQPF